MKELVSPKQVARAIGVSESSLKRWCDQGLIPAVRTAGGHRRLPIAGVMAYLRSGNHRLVRPELLGLPRAAGRGTWVIEKARERLRAALVEGDDEVSVQVVMDLYLAQQPLETIADLVIAEAFREIGKGWDCGDVEVYQERRACQICMRALHELRTALPPPSSSAPLAIGATPEGDHYTLPTTLVDLVLLENGWRATSLGSSIPFDSMRAALVKDAPALFWLSVSFIENETKFLDSYASLQVAAEANGVPLVVGGRALNEKLRRRMNYTACFDNLKQLVSFTKTLARRQSA